MNTYYLGLDLNLPQDIKIIKLKRKLGFCGFGLYIELKLKLAQSPNYELSKSDYSDLAYEFRLEEKYIQDLVENFDLFTIENDKFFCLDVKQKMLILEAKKEAGRKAGKASGKARKKKKGTVVERSFEQSLNNKDKEIKEIKEIKENKNKEIIKNFYQNFDDIFKVIQEFYPKLENQQFNSEQTKIIVENLFIQMLDYYTNGKGKTKEIKDMLATFKNWLLKIPQSKFYVYLKLDQKPLEKPKEQPENVYKMSRSKFATEEELQNELAYYAESMPNLKVIVID